MNLFKTGKPFYKGNFHCHTTESDGALPPEEVIEQYREMGYDFLNITDHRRVTIAENHMDGDMLLLSGTELDYTLSNEVVHIVGFGLTSDVSRFVNYNMGPNGGIDAIRACGGRAIIAHPHWSLNTLATLSGMRDATAAEVYNTMSILRPDSSEILDVAAAHGTLLPFVAADDSHAYDGEQGVSYTMVQADELTADGIKHAMDNGLFYASQGPRFEQISIEEGQLFVKCSPVQKIFFHSNLVWTPDRALIGDKLTGGSYQLHIPQGESFVRCQIIDENGKSAWCSPIAL